MPGLKVLHIGNQSTLNSQLVHSLTCTRAGEEAPDTDSNGEDTFLADTAGVTEGPLALYRKQRAEGLYRRVRPKLHYLYSEASRLQLVPCILRERFTEHHVDTMYHSM